MKFLFITWKNDAGQLAWQVKKEGHAVRLYIDYRSCADCYDGLIEKVKKPWQNHVDWADVIVFDEIGFGKEADNLRKIGKLVIGGTAYTDKLEWNRNFGQQEMKRLGIETLGCWEFSNFTEAISHIRKQPRRYVFKPQGVVSSADHSLLTVGQDSRGKDILELLQTNQNKWKNKIRRFLLQEFADGIEIAIGGFFNGHNFLFPLCLNQEYKRLFPGNLGPLTNDMGALIFWSQPNKMYEKTLLKISEELARVNYVGYFDINCIANKRGIYPLEFTARFGYPTIDAQLAALKIPVGEFLIRLAKGKNFAIPIKKPLQVGICGVLPTFIQENPNLASAYHNKSISINAKNWDLPELFYKDIKLDGNQLRIAGESKFIVTSVGQGKTVAVASRKAYRAIGKIKTHNIFYRSDIGKNWNSDFTRLKKWGHLAPIK